MLAEALQEGMRQKVNLESDRFMAREVSGYCLEDSEGQHGARGRLEYYELVGGDMGIEDHHPRWV